MALMDRLAFSISIISAFLATNSFSTSIAYERPVHTIVLSFATCAFLLLSLGRAVPALFKPLQSEQKYRSIPLHERSPTVESQKSSSTAYEQHDNGVTTKKSGVIFLGAILALSLRVEVYRRISKATECTVNSLEVFLPFLCAIYDAIRNGQIVEVDVKITKLWRYTLRQPFRYVPPALILSTGCYMACGLWSATVSTYICPIVVRQATTIPLLQAVAVALDVFLVIAAIELSLPSQRPSSPGRPKGPMIWATILITSATIWSIAGITVYFAVPDYRSWVLPFDLIFSIDFASSLVAQVLLLSTLCISTLASIMQHGLLYATMSLTALCVIIPSVRFIWSNSGPFPPVSPATTAFAFILIHLGWWSFEFTRQCLGLSKRHSILRQGVILLLLLSITYPGWSRSTLVDVHPIDALIRNAKAQHQQYLKDVRRSNSLQDAVVEYKRRYSIRPPPGFDVWYEYATNRSTTVIDEFDQIYHDLLPFRLTSPADLRRQTWEMVSNPWNEISGITIRAGEAKVQENVLPTHRWMLEGVAILINSFARYLPDMDLAFNLNDESRVAIPYADISSLKKQAQNVKLSGFGSWSSNRSAGWLPIPEEEYHESVFRDSSFRNTFSNFGSIGCDPRSNARRNRHTSFQSHLCLSCIGPHSDGQFVSNWSLAADVCHQPDLSHLHGFYLSPAAFKTSYKAMPVFSQSKPHGYNDILYPSAWNYMDKAKYAPTDPSGELGTDTYQPGFPDPDFRLKENTLFWRGATSEGVSSGDHAWRGMTRQRLVHMANNLTFSAHDYATILLPEGDDGRFKYRNIPGPLITDLGLKTDIAIVNNIARCGGIGLHDCFDQETEFALVSPSDFQSHWKYRYLFDLDGAGFSGRFLPFIQSKSLPFKSALFREWYDSRLTAWRHFVPQDLRLHGVWSTLAYFAGVNGILNGKEVIMAPHLKKGEEIANAGREWAGKVLRKEDMELYFFRLLLEWGRLTDDHRDNLGFSI